MGTVFGNNSHSAAAVLGDFSFFAGVPDTALLDAVSVPLLVPQNDIWTDAIASHLGPRVQPVIRYATRKDTVFDREILQTYAHSLSKSYTIRIISQELYDLCWKNSWSRDLVSQYPTWESYRDLGLGVAVLRDSALVAGASSYASFDGGIEIEIDTKPEERRRGLARACGAHRRARRFYHRILKNERKFSTWKRKSSITQTPSLPNSPPRFYPVKKGKMDIRWC